MISGNNLHEKNINFVSRFIQNLSIYTSTYESLVNWEFVTLSNTTKIHNQANHLNQRFLCSGMCCLK